MPHCVLDTKDYKHTLTIGNTHCFSATTMVARNAPKCYVIRTLPGLLQILRFWTPMGHTVHGDRR